MGKLRPTDFYLYRWRFYIGYGIAVAVLAIFLLFVGQNVPGALSQAEMNAVVRTANITISDPTTYTVTSLPYNLLQKFSIHLFGVTPIGIKLPSLILAFIASIGAVLLLRRWFRPNIAVLATLLLVTTGQFLYLAQTGTPGITYILWSVWLLLAATMVTNKDAKYSLFWKLLFFVLAGLSLYTPLSLYLLLAIISAALLHPHVRFVLKHMKKRALALFGLLMIILVAPLGYLISMKPSLLLELMGKPADWPPDIAANGWLLLREYFDFISPSAGPLMTPIFGLGSIILIGLGAWQLARTSYNARSYTIAVWLVLLIPVLLINPLYTSITFVPFLLLMASGLEYLLRSWYGIFPHNPYARVIGFVPLVVLVGGLVISGVDRYVYGYHYDPDIVKSFSKDSKLLNKRLAKTKEPVAIIVSQNELGFYRVLAAHAAKKHRTSIVVGSDPKQYQDKTATVIVSKAAQPQYDGNMPLSIITTSISENADRFYVYKNTSK